MTRGRAQASPLDLLLTLGTLGLVVLVLVLSLTAPAAGQVTNTSAAYYNGTGSTVDNATWMDGRTDPTLENSTHMFSRIGGVTIGAGERAAGTLLIGLLAFAVVVSITGTSDVGIVGGGVVSLITISALTRAGFAPGWMWLIVLFGLGAVAFRIFKRVLR